MVTPLHQLLFSLGQEPACVNGKNQRQKNRWMKKRWMTGGQTRTMKLSFMSWSFLHLPDGGGQVMNSGDAGMIRTPAGFQGGGVFLREEVSSSGELKQETSKPCRTEVWSHTPGLHHLMKIKVNQIITS